MARQAEYNKSWTCANDTSNPSIHYCRNITRDAYDSCYFNMRFETIVVKMENINHTINFNSTQDPQPDQISCQNITIGK